MYASAVETVKNQFQPSGTDYIIHVLGDTQREQYLEKFQEGNFQYVADVDKANRFRYWIRNANWFFYRELYKEYKPAFVTEYNMFFDKNNQSNNNSDEYFIPVTLINGKGKVEITVYPNDNAKLDISNAEVVDTYDVIFSYCYARANKSTEGNKIYIDKNKENIAILEGVKELKVNDVTKKVINYEEDERYIQLELESEASEFAYPNVFEVIK